jgi:hypothetical protein
MVMGVFKKQGVYWIDYYVQGHRKRERIGPDKRLADTVLRKHKVEAMTVHRGVIYHPSFIRIDAFPNQGVPGICQEH